MAPHSEHIVHQDLWMTESAKRLKEQNKAEFEAAVDSGFNQAQGVIAYSYGILVLVLTVWLLWWLKNYLRIDLFPNRNFDVIEDSEKLLD